MGFDCRKSSFTSAGESQAYAPGTDEAEEELTPWLLLELVLAEDGGAELVVEDSAELAGFELAVGADEDDTPRETVGPARKCSPISVGNKARLRNDWERSEPRKSRFSENSFPRLSR